MPIHISGKFLIAVLLIFAIVGCETNTRTIQVKNVKEARKEEANDGPTLPNKKDFAERVLKASNFCKEEGFEERVAIFIDLELHSGSYRCFVVELPSGTIRVKGLVTHGSGQFGLFEGQRKYSNENGSYLSSLGKYKTGISYNGQFGLAYKLHGLDSSNSNAYNRYIVLHAHACVPDTETSEMICQSWGCPTVSETFLKTLQKIIDNSRKPLLLWMYDGKRG